MKLAQLPNERTRLSLVSQAVELFDTVIFWALVDVRPQICKNECEEQKKRHNSNKGDVNIVGAKQQVERKWLSGFKNCLLLLPQSNRNSRAALALEEWQSFGGFQVFYWWQLISNRKVKNQLSQKPLIISRSQKKKSSSFSAVQQEEKQHN